MSARIRASVLRGLICLLSAAATSVAQDLKVTSVAEGTDRVIKVKNAFLCPITFSLTANLTNMESSEPFPVALEIPAGKTVEICRFKVIDPSVKTDWRHNWNYRLGSVESKHDDSIVYALPYPPGKTYRVSQGFFGDFSHTGEFSHSIDWSMPIGSQVTAARAGEVVRLKSDSDEGGPDRKFFKRSNYVIVEHDDGTLGEYQHLRKDGVLVKLGQRVEVGDPIGLSGNTGFSSKPHLHFHVCVPVDSKDFRSVPIKFQTASDSAVELKQGVEYTRPNPPATGGADGGAGHTKEK
jgi:murein DD-endopeptidase MepM/ murein hydrolase activator NlpD